MPGDAELLSAYADSGDEAAFAELVRRHVDGVYSSALRRLGGDVHLAEDVVQRVFVILARKADRLIQHPALTAWLYLTVRQETAQLVRSERRRKAREQEAVVMNETSADKKETDWTHVAPVLDEALDALGERDRTAILLRFVHQQAFAEMGRALQLSEDAARMRVERALEKLQRLLVRRGITSSTAALGVALADHAVVAAPAGLAATAAGQAMSATAASAVPLSGGLIFMSLSKITSVIVGGALAIAVVGIALHERSQTEEARTDFESTRSAEAAGKAALARVQQREAEARRSVEALRARFAELRTASFNEKKKQAEWNGVEAGAAFLARHPDVEKAFSDLIDAGIRTRFGQLFTSLHLTPAQIDRFLAIMRSSSTQAFPFGPQGQLLMLRTGEDIPFDQRMAQLKAVLGADGYQQYVQFNRGIPSRSVVTQVARDLAFSETPLTTEQANLLDDLIGKNRFTPAGVRMQATDWPAVIAAAKPTLAKEQIEVLEQWAIHEADQIQSRREISDPKSAAQSRPSQL